MIPVEKSWIVHPPGLTTGIKDGRFYNAEITDVKMLDQRIYGCGDYQ
jgi:hypothetical protein